MSLLVWKSTYKDIDNHLYMIIIDKQLLFC